MTCIHHEMTDRVKNGNLIIPQAHGQLSPYQRVMQQRWLNSIKSLPAVDKRDISKEEPLVNGNKIRPLFSRHQHCAELSQTCFLRLRMQEEATLMFDYLDPNTSSNFQAYLKTTNKRDRLFSA